MKLLFFLASFFIFNDSFSQLTTHVAWTKQSSMPASAVIYYDTPNKLRWNDFLGDPQDRGLVAAMTVSGFGYNAGVRTINGKGQLNIMVYCYFDKDKSWVKPGKNTDYILTHEQHHFDVSYIVANIFFEKLKNTVFTTGNFNSQLAYIYKECCDAMNKMQNDYDGETKNGQLKDEQSKWNDLIDDKINAVTN